MAEPKVRFKLDDGISYPPYSAKTLGDCFEERNQRASGSEELLAVTQARGVILQSETDKRNVSSSDKSNYKVVCVGDIAYNSMRMWQGAEGVSAYNGIVSPAYTIISPRHRDINAYYFEKYFKTYKLLKIFERNSQGITSDTWNLKYPAFSRIKVNVPCAEEQKKIADFLSSVDNVISTSEQEVANFETLKKAVMKKIFSQEVRFKRGDGTDFPEWEETRLGDVCSKIGSGKTPKGGSEVYTQDGVLFIRSQNVTNAMLDLADRTCIPKSVHEGMRNTELQYLDVLLNITGASIGRCCLFDLHEIANVNQHVCIIRLKDKESYIPKYVEQIMLSDYIQNQIWSCQNGGSREGLNFEQIGNFSFLSPCFEEQRLIADFLSNFDEAIAAAKKELELWKELKKGLLQKMFV